MKTEEIKLIVSKMVVGEKICLPQEDRDNKLYRKLKSGKNQNIKWYEQINFYSRKHKIWIEKIAN